MQIDVQIHIDRKKPIKVVNHLINNNSLIGMRVVDEDSGQLTIWFSGQNLRIFHAKAGELIAKLDAAEAAKPPAEAPPADPRSEAVEV